MFVHMHRLLLSLTLVAATLTNSLAADQDFSASSLVAKGSTLHILADGFSFTEGPASDAKGNIYFTDQPNDRIMKWSIEGKLSTFLQPSGRSNGLCFDATGNLIACADGKNEMWSIDPQGKHTVLFQRYEDKLLNGPNDVWLRPDGGLYFSDPFYKRPYWERGPQEQSVMAVYYVPADRNGMKRVIDDFTTPNGLIGTPDGKTLYVTDIKAKQTWRYTIGVDGSLSDKSKFCDMGSDGMTIDEQGNVYLTGKGVTVFDSAGKQILQIEVPEKWTANICFGGADNKLLFITASKSVYGLRMAVSGAGSQ